MTTIDYAKLDQELRFGCHEYKGVLNKLSRKHKLLIYSFTKIKLDGEGPILDWCYKIGKVLGFEPGSVQVKFHGKRNRAAASALRQTFHFPRKSNVHTIIHEFTHLLASSTRVYGSVHNDGFTRSLIWALEKVAEHADEWNIKLFTQEEIVSESHCFVPKPSAIDVSEIQVIKF